MSVLIFFFKQKTAYEMRISDWSSDVCSSDLPVTGGGAMTRLQTERLMLTSMLPEHEAELYTLHNDPLVQASIFENIPQSHADVKAKLEQIGRASCRERVCQYV